MSDPSADQPNTERLRRALAELRFLEGDSLRSAIGDYEPELAAAVQQQLAAEEAAFAAVLSLTGAAFDAAFAAFDPLTAEGVRLRREALVEVDPLLGTVDHDFKLTRILGTGGGGRVYQVERQSYTQTMALKLLAGWDQAARRRFDHERGVLARMHHPFIVHLADAWERSDGKSALLMELVDGVPITAYADAKRLGIEARLELIERVIQAIAYAHQLGVLHRDLKPGNILVTADGVPKVLDFGIAKIVSRDATKTVGFQGTFAYASPEQLGQRSLDQRTDVFSLGVILCELMSGCHAYASGADRMLAPDRMAPSMGTLIAQLPAEQANAVAASRQLALRDLRRRLRSDLGVVVAKALHADRERRYATVTELAADLAAVRRGLPIAARADSLWYGLQRLVKNNRAASLIAAILVVSVAGFAVREFQQNQRIGTLAVDAFQRMMVTLRAAKNLPDKPSKALREAKQNLLRTVTESFEKVLAGFTGSGIAEAPMDRLDAMLLLAECASEVGDLNVARQQARATLDLADRMRGAQVDEELWCLDKIAARALVLAADCTADDENRSRERLYDQALSYINAALTARSADVDLRSLQLLVREHRLNHRRMVEGPSATAADLQQWIADAKALQPWADKHQRAAVLVAVAFMREAEAMRDAKQVTEALQLFEATASRLDAFPRDWLTREVLRLRVRVQRIAGDTEMLLGRADRAVVWFAKTRDQADDYLREDPDELDMGLSLSRSLFGLGEAQRALRNPEARGNYDRMLVVRRQLRERHPDNQAVLRELVMGEYAMGGFEGAEGHAKERLEHLVEAARLGDALVQMTKAVGTDYDFAAELYAQVAAFQQAGGDVDAAKLAAARSEQLFETCLLYAPSLQEKNRELLAAVRQILVPADELALLAHKQQVVAATRATAAASLRELHEFGCALYALAKCYSDLEEWTDAEVQWREACSVWRRIVDESKDPVYRPAYRDVLLRACECMAAGGTLTKDADFLRDAITFCAEWRSDAGIGSRLDAIEAAARRAGLDGAAADAIFRRAAK